MAAAAGLGRLLEARGFSLHDLVARVEAPAEILFVDAPQSGPWWNADAALVLERLAGQLRPHELNFIESMLRRRSPPTERQASWLDSLRERAEGAA